MRIGLIAAAVLAGFCADAADDPGVRLTVGVNGAASPAGGRIAFQKRFGLYVRLGLYDIGSKSVEWIEDGEVCAAFPAWSPDGATLVYALGDRKHTAYENWIKPKFNEGYRLRTWKDGVKTDILEHGRWYDCSPAFAPDGKTIWYCSNRRTADDTDDDFFGNRMWRMTLGQPQSGACVYDPSSGADAGVSQPVVAPDGKTVCWAELNDFGQPWSIRVSHTGGTIVGTRLTPRKMSAYAPNWSPDGRYLTFTGCSVTDTCWSVYLLDPRQVRMRRICAGENPSFLPENGGLSLVYDRDGYLWKRPLAAAEYPTAGDEITDYDDDVTPWTEPEKVLFSISAPDGGLLDTNITSKAELSKLVFDGTSTSFWKVVFDWNGDTHGLQSLMLMRYAEHGNGSQVYLYTGGEPSYSTRQNTADKSQAWVHTPGPLPTKGVHTIVGIRTDSHLWLSVDGQPVGAEATFSLGLISLQTPTALQIGREAPEGTRVLSVTIGSGWPASVPCPTTLSLKDFDWEVAE